MYGLNPNSKFLDIGCGALRLGFLIMNYLDSSRYYEVEPNVAMLDEGKNILAKGIIENKKPLFPTLRISHFMNNLDATTLILLLRDRSSLMHQESK